MLHKKINWRYESHPKLILSDKFPSIEYCPPLTNSFNLVPYLNSYISPLLDNFLIQLHSRTHFHWWKCVHIIIFTSSDYGSLNLNQIILFQEKQSFIFISEKNTKYYNLNKKSVSHYEKIYQRIFHNIISIMDVHWFKNILPLDDCFHIWFIYI